MLPTEENKDDFFKIALSSSLVLYGFDGKNLKILIRERATAPFKGAFILPSTYILPNDSIEGNIQKLLEEKIGISNIYLEQLKAFTKVFRNPLGRVINVAFYGLIKIDDRLLLKNQEEGNVWVNVEEVPELAYDHNEIIEYAKERLKRRVKRRPIGFNLLPNEFTILQLQTLYEKSFGKELDKRNFRKKLFKSKLILDTGKFIKPKNARKASKLYTFDKELYQTMKLKGYDITF
ncbi:MAG: NUDIX domain-containing protein [Solirubrobacteraceae bacterium]